MTRETKIIPSSLWLGSVPKEWKHIKVRYLGDLGRGRVISNLEMVKNGKYPVYSSQTKNKGEMGRLNSFDFEGEYVTWTTDGANAGTVFSRTGKFNCTNVCGTIKVRPGVSTKYLAYALSIETKRYVRLDINPKLMNTEMAEIKVLLPALKEQKNIEKYLDNKTSQIDSLIADKERLIELLEEKRQAVITETVTKGLDPNVKMKDSGIEWIGEIPEHWEVEKLKWISQIELSNVDKKTVKGEVPVLLCNYVDVYYNNEITPDLDFMKATAKKDQINKFSLKKNDVIITKDSEDPNDIAIPTWVSQTMNNVLCGYHLAQIRPKDILSGKYLLYSLLSTTFQEQFHSLAYGVTRYGILKGDIENSLFNLPPYEEQVEISKYLTKVDEEIESIICQIKKQSYKLREYRESLIYEAVTGKIDVRNYEVEPIEV